MKNKLSLGTAQFGLDYGINNKTGKLSPPQVFDILESATQNQVHFLDTAPAYGDSQRTIGEYIARKGVHFDIVSKLPPCSADEVETWCERTLQQLHTDQLYGYLMHSFSTYLSAPEIFGRMLKLKDRLCVQKIGFSLYSPDELDYLLENEVQFDLLQIPYSIVDRRFESHFATLKGLGIEIHARSIYLQGLLFKKEHELTGNLVPFGQIIQMLRELSSKHNCEIDEIATRFVLSRQDICKIVVGVDNLNHFKRLLSITEFKGSDEEIMSIANRISSIEVDAEMLIPSNWKA